jgi:fermentation-respiration switch protein FrsA (DUF1100 family)
MRTATILLYGSMLFIAACQRLDSNLFNRTDKLTEYQLDDYTGEQDFILDATYDIPDSLVHIFSLQSQTADESASTTIYAIYIGEISQIATDTVILYCHGNKWHMDFYWQRAKLLAHTGGKNRHGVLMLDYRGYGMSDGEPTEEGLYADVDAAMKWLMQNGMNNDRLAIYGFSMGSAPATELCSKPRTLTPGWLLLEAPFASAAVMVEDGTQLAMPSSYLTNLEIDCAEEIKRCSQPLFWTHGLSDMFLSYTTHGQVVYNNHNGVYKESHPVEGADHGEVPAKTGFTEYCNSINSFLTQH